MKTSYEMFPDETDQRIDHLMRVYGWCGFEARCYFFYESYDPSDWLTYE